MRPSSEISHVAATPGSGCRLSDRLPREPFEDGGQMRPSGWPVISAGSTDATSDLVDEREIGRRQLPRSTAHATAAEAGDEQQHRKPRATRHVAQL